MAARSRIGKSKLDRTAETLVLKVESDFASALKVLELVARLMLPWFVRMHMLYLGQSVSDMAA